MFGKMANFQSNSWNASQIVEKVRLLWLMNKHLKILKERKRKNLPELILEEKLDSSKSFTSYEDALVSNHSNSRNPRKSDQKEDTQRKTDHFKTCGRSCYSTRSVAILKTMVIRC